MEVDSCCREIALTWESLHANVIRRRELTFGCHLSGPSCWTLDDDEAAASRRVEVAGTRFRAMLLVAAPASKLQIFT
jgi:hypothetical protein